VAHLINFNVGLSQGGDWASSVPAWSIFDMRVTVYPGQDLAEGKAEIEVCTADAAAANSFLTRNSPEVVYHGQMAEGYVLENSDAVVAVLGAAHLAAYGKPLATKALTATTDARCFGLYAGIPALVYGPVSENIHGFNERVNLESVRKNTQATELFVAEWCGLEAAGRNTAGEPLRRSRSRSRALPAT